MLKSLLFTLSLIFTVVAMADTHTIFSSDKATIIIQGKPGDKDAPNLFNALSINADDIGSSFEKNISFTSASNEKLFSIKCKIAKSIPDYGSCNITIFKSKISVIQPDVKFISLMIQYPDSVDALNQFVSPPPSATEEMIFLSADSHLGIYAQQKDKSIHIFYK